MPSTSNRQASIDSRRIALEREIAIRVPRFDTFVSEYSSNISTTGMFIVSDKPQAPGTTFTFEFSVADDWKLIRGRAQVVWTRYRDEADERPAGMGVRFVELDPQSRRLIRWIVEKQIREGGKPFELDELRTVIDEALEEAIDTDRAVSASATRGGTAATLGSSRKPRARRPAPAKAQASSERNILPLVATAAAIVLGIALLFWLTEWLPGADDRQAAAAAAAAASPVSDSEAVADFPNGPAGGGGGESEPEGSPDSVLGRTDLARGSGANATEGNASSSPPIGPAYESVRDSLANWSAAWSAQNANGYLGAYSRDFKPNGSSRSAWEATRRERLRAPEFIKVSITKLEITRVQDNLVRASFFQTYRSDRFSDAVRKEVEMVWEEGAWRIWRELAR